MGWLKPMAGIWRRFSVECEAYFWTWVPLSQSFRELVNTSGWVVVSLVIVKFSRTAFSGRNKMLKMLFES